MTSNIRDSRKSLVCSNHEGAWSLPISSASRNEQARLRAFTLGGAACKTWLPWSRTPVSQRWKRRRCGPHASLLSQEQALSGHTKAKTNGRSKRKRNPRAPTVPLHDAGAQWGLGTDTSPSHLAPPHHLEAFLVRAVS